MKTIRKSTYLAVMAAMVGLLTITVSEAKKPGGGGGPGGGDSLTGVVYAKDYILGTVLAIHGAGEDDLGFNYLMEPSHATHDGARWFTRQFVHQGETNPDGITQRYTPALFDGGSTVIWVDLPAGVSVASRFLDNPVRWITYNGVPDGAVSFLGIDHATTTAGVYVVPIDWVLGAPVPQSAVKVGDLDIVVRGQVHIPETDPDDPANYVPDYAVHARGFDWDRDGARYVVARGFNFNTEDEYYELWIGDAPLLRTTDGTAVQGVLPEWSRGGVSSIAYEAVWSIWTVDEDGANENLAAATYSHRGTTHFLESPRWSPDGSQLLYDARYIDSRTWVEMSSTYRIPRSGGSAVELIRGADRLYNLGWRNP